MPAEPIYDIAHLGHLEMLTPKFEESRKFFVDVMGMTQSGEKGDSVYLRGWDDYERYSLKLTASKTSGMAHVAFRTRTPQALERRAAALKGSGFDVGWSSATARLSSARTPMGTPSSSTTTLNGTTRPRTRSRP
jgi:catechol 2,3-dioxygenase